LDFSKATTLKGRAIALALLLRRHSSDQIANPRYCNDQSSGRFISRSHPVQHLIDEALHCHLKGFGILALCRPQKLSPDEAIDVRLV